MPPVRCPLRITEFTAATAFFSAASAALASLHRDFQLSGSTSQAVTNARTFSHEGTRCPFIARDSELWEMFVRSPMLRRVGDPAATHSSYNANAKAPAAPASRFGGFFSVGMVPSRQPRIGLARGNWVAAVPARADVSTALTVEEDGLSANCG